MKKIVVADIFGLTSALATFVQSINADLVIEPYNGLDMDFADEKAAYDYFINYIGVKAYTKKLHTIISHNADDFVLIGFSVGASAVWQASEIMSTPQCQRIKKAYCFYGSQIRHFTHISPKFPTSLIFPQYENHFDVGSLKKLLSHTDLVDAGQVEFMHGFMNRYSENFNQVGYERYITYFKTQYP